MNIFALEIWDDEASLCTFYTVRWDDTDVNETDKFFDKYNSNPEYKEYAQELLVFILESIGENHGAINKLFNRKENEVTGLPVKGKVKVDEITFFYPDFPLRLYALRINEEIVVLFNGGIKDGPTNQKSSLHMQWVDACEFAKKIINALHDGTIIIDNKKRILKSFDSTTEINL